MHLITSLAQHKIKNNGFIGRYEKYAIIIGDQYPVIIIQYAKVKGWLQIKFIPQNMISHNPEESVVKAVVLKMHWKKWNKAGS